jgi:Ca2+-binding EF-hand superfamily protein
VGKELGQEISEPEINKVFKYIDTDGDGKISFEEFYEWWLHGKQNKLEKLVFMKMKL